jgi:hypothetical protein
MGAVCRTTLMFNVQYEKPPKSALVRVAQLVVGLAFMANLFWRYNIFYYRDTGEKREQGERTRVAFSDSAPLSNVNNCLSSISLRRHPAKNRCRSRTDTGPRGSIQPPSKTKTLASRSSSSPFPLLTFTDSQVFFSFLLPLDK